MAESARASNVYTLAAEARPPCSGPSTGLDRSARRRSGTKASLRWRPGAHPASTTDGAESAASNA
jgi:hypothetical protein